MVSKPASASAKKPKQKGYWRTFAPPNRIQNVDDLISPSIGNFIEVVVVWKDRILSFFHFSKGDVYMGASKECEIPVNNLLELSKYKLLEIKQTAQIFFSYGVTGKLFQGKEKSTRSVREIKGTQNLTLKPYEMVRLDFKDTLKVYVRMTDKPAHIIGDGILNMSLSEMAVLFFSLILTGFLIFYSVFYAPLFLLEEETFKQEKIHTASVKFIQAPKTNSVVDYKLGEKNKAVKIKKSTRSKQIKKSRQLIKRRKNLVSRTKKKASVSKPLSIKKIKKSAGVSASLRGKKKKTSQAGSLRPGGSLKTGKSGASPKTVTPDPSKMGLLGVFGQGGKLKKLDKGASGTSKGGLIGLAQEATGFAGTKESYGGEGIGTRTKDLGSGGEGQNIVGIPKIKTKGRGGALKGTGTGGLGLRGRMSIDIGEDDIEVDGEIDREAILRVIKSNANRFDRCYQSSLQRDSSLEGSLKMQWQILATGSVRAVRAIEDKVNNTALRNCVGRVIGSLNFPKPPSGQIPRISFKFVFSR